MIIKNNIKSAIIKNGGSMKNIQNITEISIKNIPKESITSRVSKFGIINDGLNRNLTTLPYVNNILNNNNNSSNVSNGYDIVYPPDGNFFTNLKIWFLAFIKSDFFYFMKYYFYYIILFSICFLILMKMNSESHNDVIKIESKIFFYLLIVFLFIIVSDILETPLESLKKFFLIILISTILVYTVNYIVNKYYINHYFSKFMVVFLTSLSIYVLFTIIIYFMFERNNKAIGVKLFSSFNFAISRNFYFLLFTFIYLIMFYKKFKVYNKNTNLYSIIGPMVLGIMLIFFIFIFIIYVCRKLKIITKLQKLSSFIVLYYIAIFLFIVYLFIAMNSLGSICKDSADKKENNNERIGLLILLCIFFILWFMDSRHWNKIGYLIFIIATIFTLYVFFVYSISHPSVSMLSLWLFIEWIILIFYRKEDTKNSLHYLFMKT